MVQSNHGIGAIYNFGWKFSILEAALICGPEERAGAAWRSVPERPGGAAIGGAAWLSRPGGAAMDGAAFG